MTQIKTKLTGVPRTMLMTTRARVDEHQRDVGALFRDPKVFEWWQAIAWDTELDRFYQPLSQLSWAVRANTFDQVAQRHIASYADAIVVELGAGLSTRYYRVGRSCKCWIDLDLPEVTNLRRQLDSETQQHRFISRSALDFGWMDELPDCPSEHLLIIAEGLLMYFTVEQVQQLINQLHQRFPNATFMFDVVGGASKGKVAKWLAELGAPMQWFVKNERDLDGMGLATAVRDNGGGIVIGTEIVHEKVVQARKNIVEAGLETYVDIREGDALKTLKTFNQTVDLVLIDGWTHLALDVLKILDPLIRPSGIVVSGNVNTFKEALKDYVDFLQNPANGYRSSTLNLKAGTEFSVKVRRHNEN